MKRLTHLHPRVGSSVTMRNILIVEDDKDFAQCLHVSLGDLFSIEVCHSFQEAVQWLHRRPFEIILCDYLLGASDGLSLAEHAKSLSPSPHFVMMTAFADKEMAIKSLNSGVRHLIEKPFSVVDLRSVLTGILEGKKTASIAMEFFPGENSVVWKGERIQLTATEYLILTSLFANMNSWISREDLEKKLWGQNANMSRNVVDTHLSNLRKKVPCLRDCLTVVRGRGFFLKSCE